MAEHTPGPWELNDPEDDPKGFRKIYGGTYANRPIGQVVKRQSRKEEDYANALLIASAPKLLAIVEGFLATLDTDDLEVEAVVRSYYNSNIELFNFAIDTHEKLKQEEGG